MDLPVKHVQTVRVNAAQIGRDEDISSNIGIFFGYFKVHEHILAELSAMRINISSVLIKVFVDGCI